MPEKNSPDEPKDNPEEVKEEEKNIDRDGRERLPIQQTDEKKQ